MRVTPRRLSSALALLALLLVVTSLAGPRTHGATFVWALGELVLCFALLWLPGQVLLWRARPSGLDENDLFLLAIPTSLLGYAAIGALLFWISAPALVFKLLLLPAVGAAAFGVVRKLVREGELVLPPSVPVTVLIAACAVCFVCVGQTRPWENMTWLVPAARGLHELPLDNNLPFMTAQVFIDATPAWTLGPLTMGDRPPLMAVITAVFAKAFLFRDLTFFDFTLLGILLNSLFALPLVEYARKLLPSRRTALFVTVSMLLTPPLFLNVFFTWPKTFGMFFTLTGLALFTRRAPGSPWAFPARRTLLVLGVLLGLSILCHAGSGLSIPLVLVLLACFGRSGPAFQAASKRGLLQLAVAGAVTVSVALLLQAPWKIYKLRHPEIDTNLLLYHYIPFVPPAEPPPLLDWLASTGAAEQLTQRLGQVRDTLLGGEFGKVLRALYTGEVVRFDKRRWKVEFRQPAAQVGELRILLGVIAMAALATLAKRKPPRLRPPSTPDLRMSALTIVLAIANYLAHVFLKWKTIAPHELPLVEIYLVAVPLTVACFAFSRSLSILLMLVITERFFSYVVACTFARQLPADLFAFGVFASVFGLLWLCASEPEDRGPDPEDLNRAGRAAATGWASASPERRSGSG